MTRAASRSLDRIEAVGWQTHRHRAEDASSSGPGTASPVRRYHRLQSSKGCFRGLARSERLTRGSETHRPPAVGCRKCGRCGSQKESLHRRGPHRSGPAGITERTRTHDRHTTALAWAKNRSSDRQMAEDAAGLPPVTGAAQMPAGPDSPTGHAATGADGWCATTAPCRPTTGTTARNAA